ncbi:MAG: hypothetical protein LUD72_01060 [Bacteroidales bacterium]|nr:hypothetical protein [Bacteroidales bacterium]
MISIGNFITLVRDQRSARLLWEKTRDKGAVAQAARLGRDIDRIIATQDIAEEGLFDVVEDMGGYRCAVIEEKRPDGSWRLTAVVSEKELAYVREGELKERVKRLKERYLTDFRYWYGYIKTQNR